MEVKYFHAVDGSINTFQTVTERSATFDLLAPLQVKPLYAPRRLWRHRAPPPTPLQASFKCNICHSLAITLHCIKAPHFIPVT